MNGDEHARTKGRIGDFVVLWVQVGHGVGMGWLDGPYPRVVGRGG